MQKEVAVVQYDENGPSDKPIWMWYGGNMYLGFWKQVGNGNDAVEHGVGVYYYHETSPSNERGGIYVGQIRNGLKHGKGECFWLESSDVWRNNHRVGSMISQTTGGRSHGVPFHYKGEFVNNKRHDDRGIATLKDGTTRIGPWKDDIPVGNWHHHELIEPGVSSSSGTRSEAFENGSVPNERNSSCGRESYFFVFSSCERQSYCYRLD